MSQGTNVVRIPQEWYVRLSEMAKETGHTKTYYMTKAIERFWEDYVDGKNVKRVLKHSPRENARPLSEFLAEKTNGENVDD